MFSINYASSVLSGTVKYHFVLVLTLVFNRIETVAKSGEERIQSASNAN